MTFPRMSSPWPRFVFRVFQSTSEALGGMALMPYQDSEQDMEHFDPDPPQIEAFLGRGDPQGLDIWV
jgi:hypothetical protein